MPKGLTRNDLLYILNEAFKISKASNNALEFTENGLYVESYKLHSNSSDLHMPSKEAHDIVAALSVNENGTLLYNGEPAGIFISDDDDNAIEFSSEDGGLFVRRVYDQSDFETHVQDNIVHVTQEDRDEWDGILDNAKDYTDDEIDKIKIHNVVYLTSIPEPENMDPHTMYILLDQENIFENPIIVIKVLNEVVKIGVTKASMNNYYTKTEIDDTFETKDHSLASYMPKLKNEDTLSMINNDNGHPVFNNKKFLSSRANNGLSCDNDGGLFYPDVSSELNSLQISAAFAKTNLYDQQITDVGVYTLKDSINNYNLLLAEYWFYPPAIIYSPVYKEVYNTYKAPDNGYGEYSLVFGNDRMGELWETFNDRGGLNSEKYDFIYDFDFYANANVFKIVNKEDVVTHANDYSLCYAYSDEDFLEYTCRFEVFNNMHGTNSRYAFWQFVICRFYDENGVQHKLSVSRNNAINDSAAMYSPNYITPISMKYTGQSTRGTTAGYTSYYGDPGGVSSDYDSFRNTPITREFHSRDYRVGMQYYTKAYIAVDYNVHENIGIKIDNSQINNIYSFYELQNSQPNVAVFVQKTTQYVKIWMSTDMTKWRDGELPTESPTYTLTYANNYSTLAFENAKGQIGFEIGNGKESANVDDVRCFRNVVLKQHTYYEKLESVVDRIETIENPEHSIGYAKTALMDTDNMEFLYNRSIGYTLELGYGISNANIKLRMHDNKLYVDHLTNTAIYRITGIGKGQSVEQEPDIIVVDDNNNEEPNEEP